jgi:hypothetical protein
MHWFRFFSRVALICNCCFLAAMIIQRIPNPPEGEFISVIIVLGYPVAVFVNIAINVCYACMMFFTKIGKNISPPWLIIINFLFLVLQLVFLLILRN